MTFHWASEAAICFSIHACCTLWLSQNQSLQPSMLGMPPLLAHWPTPPELWLEQML
jgi:hypothetical protein